MIPSLPLRAGLRSLLDEEPDLLVEADAASLGALANRGVRPHVLLIAEEAFDETLLQEQLAAGSDLAVVLLGEEASLAAELNQIPLRAWGLLSTEASIEEIIVALQAVSEGLVVGSRDLIQPSFERGLIRTASDAPPLVENLTDREQEVLQLVARGLANKQIAAALQISEHTVKFHISSVYGKLGAGNRTEAVRLGVRHGLVSL